MKPKDKAQKLVSDFYSINCKLIDVKNGYDMGDRYNLVMPIAKQCALNAIKEVRFFDSRLFYASKGSLFDQYLDSVKKEIEKL